MNAQALMQSLGMTGVGMAVIFAFMALLMLFVHALIETASRFFPDPPEIEPAGEAVAAPAVGGGAAVAGIADSAPGTAAVGGKKKAAAAAAAVSSYLAQQRP